MDMTQKQWDAWASNPNVALKYFDKLMMLAMEKGFSTAKLCS